MAETAPAAVGEAYTMIEAAPHAVGEAVAESPVAAIIGSRRVVRQRSVRGSVWGSTNCSHGHPNAASQKDLCVRKFAAFHPTPRGALAPPVVPKWGSTEHQQWAGTPREAYQICGISIRPGRCTSL